MTDLLARVRAHASHLALLGTLAMVAALLVTGVPKAANGMSDRALRHDIAALSYTARDLIFRTTTVPRPELPVDPEAKLADVQRALPQPIKRLIAGEWFTASLGPEGVTTFTPAGVRHLLGLRVQSGAQQAIRFAAGRWPATGPQASRVEIAVSTDVADRMGVALGSVLAVAGSLAPVEVVVVGIFEPVDRSAPIWADAVQVLRQAPGIADEIPPSAIALTDPRGLAIAAPQLGTLTHTWRFRVDERRLDASMIDTLATEIDRARHIQTGQALAASTGLDVALKQFQRRTAAAWALLAVAGGGVVCTLLGLIGLAARLAVQRRRDELALVRARGGSLFAVGGRVLAECLLVVPVVVVAGWLLGGLVPGRPAGTGWWLLPVGVVAVVAMPAAAMVGGRRPVFLHGRTDLGAWRPSARRLTAEVSVLALAALGTYLLRRRGLAAGAGVDPFLALVPVLLAAAASVVALRVVPWPLRLAGRVAARARGAVVYLGLARAGRGGPVVAAPLAVLVVAVATGVFCSVVATTVDDARDRAAVQEIPADAMVTGYRFGAQTAGRLAAVPGVTAVAAMVDYPSVLVRGAGGAKRYARVVVVDPAAFERVAQRSGVAAELPPELRRARRAPNGVVPAVVSPDVAAQIPDRGRAATDDGFDFRVAAVVDGLPGLGVGAKNFVVLPWQALPPKPSGAPFPNRFLIAGHGFDVDSIRYVGDAGQRAFLSKGNLPEPTEVISRADRREALERTGAHELLTFAFAVGTAGGAVLALLAVGFAVLAEAGSRGQALSRLRTMGLSARQGRRLLAYELVPLLGVAVLAGAAVGVLLPRLLGGSLGLETFTGGATAGTHLDPLLVAGLLALVAAAVAGALGLEGVTNRRMRLGEVLRLGDVPGL